MKAIPAAGAALVLAVLMSGCSLLEPIQSGGSSSVSVGDCLGEMLGADSDRDSLIDCDEPHRFEVTAIVTWPGMADLVEEQGGDAGRAWDRLHTTDSATGGALITEYVDWAERECMAAAQRTLRIDDVTVGDLTAADIWLRLGGGWGVDLSLSSRDAFTRGDHRTVCSVAWYDARNQPLQVEFGGATFADLAGPDFPLKHRECWDEEYYVTPCTLPHAAQVLAGFEGIAAFGPELVTRIGDGTASEADWLVADDFCGEVLDQAMPSSTDWEDLWYIADVAYNENWEALDGAADPELDYPMSCIAGGEEQGQLFTGDYMDGSVEFVADGT